MSLARLLTQTVTVHPAAASTVDAEGNVTPGSGATTTHPGRLERTAAEEVRQGATTVLTEWRLFLMPDAAVGPHDRVEVDGVTYEVIGGATVHRTPRGPHHLEVRLRLAQT